MTHDELLARMSELSKETAYEPCFEFEDALRKVVELHKPTPLDERGDVCLTCCPDLLTLYPCSTIQIIEKELK
jgi:hypothetical protein